MTFELEVDARARLPSFELHARFVAKPGVTVLFGPTASGKTLSLRLVAGLERVSTGFVRSGGRAFDDDATFVPPHDRGVGYAPQHGSLWPHRSVREHLTAFTTPSHGSELLSLVGLAERADRKPATLSGGERQRLSLARALARSSKLLLLDEPFSALHDDARAAMGALVRERARAGAVVLFVTHDREEARRLGDAFVVFRDGTAVSSESI